MNNDIASSMIRNCDDELQNIDAIKNVVGDTSPIMKFLTRYSLIKACGTIEFTYKNIIADFCEESQKIQIKNYISNNIRNSSQNPTLDNIHRLLKDFDEGWNRQFNSMLNEQTEKDKIITSLTSLNDARNEFAHGGNPSITFKDVRDYFKDACKIIEILDKIISSNTSLAL